MQFSLKSTVLFIFSLCLLLNFQVAKADGLEAILTSEGSVEFIGATFEGGGWFLAGSSPEVVALVSTAVVISIGVVVTIQNTDSYQEDKKAIIAEAAQLIINQEAIHPNLNAPITNLLQDPDIDSTAKKALKRSLDLMASDAKDGISKFRELPERVQAFTILEVNGKLQTAE